MYFTDIFIRRPVFATVLSLIILLVGLRAYFDLPVRQFPKIDASVLTISTHYAGASPELMEGFVAVPLENALASVEGLDFMTSTNTQANSSITLNFKLGYDINKAIADVSNAVSSVRSVLPKEIDDPVIAKQDPNAHPTLYIAFLSKQLSSEQITDYLLRVVQPQVATLSGVGEAQIYGDPYAMRIWLSPVRMAALGVTPDDIQKALTNNNLQSAAGTIKSPFMESNIVANTDLKTSDQFNNLILKQTGDRLVRLQEVGRAELGSSNDRVSAYVENLRTVVMAVIPQSTANPLDVSRGVNTLLPKLQQSLPAGLNIKVLYDSSKFISASIKEVYSTIFEAALFVMVVIFFFLGSVRSVFIPMVTIPLSLIGVCGLMYMMGYTINTITLLAWVLAIGLVVDDAIVVLENIHRHMEEGLSALQAALTGAREIGFAVIAMTLTLAAVYAPIGFLQGLTGSLFREFAFTLASAVIISGFVALTLSPMMCAKILAKTDFTQKHKLAEKIDQFFNQAMVGYQRLLNKVFDRWKVVLAVAALVYVSCFFLYSTLPNELAPAEDQGYVLGIVTGPTSASLAYTEKYTAQLGRIYQGVPERLAYGIINGYPSGINSAISFLVFKPWSERKKTASDIIQALFPKMWGLAGVKAFPVNPPALPGTSGFTPVSFVVKTTRSYEELYQAMQTLLAAVRKNPALLNPDSDLKLDKSQISVNIDRDRAADLGISMNSINTALGFLLGDITASRFIMNGRSYDVMPRLLPEFMNSPNKLNLIQLHTASGSLVPLSNLVTITETIAPQNLAHFQQQRAAILTASLVPGYTLGQALAYLENAAKALPDTMQIDYAGESRQLIEASGAMLGTFVFALCVIFLVLAAQFESFRDPLIVMLSVPLSLAGALIAIHLTKGTINIFTQIGLVTLVGLISKHGILIVEFANQLQAAGRTRREAVIAAASLRLRPILMTTAAMILGAVPLAIATGAGAASRVQIGHVIVGGMSLGTLLTLFVVPTAYFLFAKTKQREVI